MEGAEEFTFRIRKFLAGIEPICEEEVARLKMWLGRNEKRFRCILEHHFGYGEYARLVEECEKDRCVVNWLKVYRYMNILGIQLEMTVYPIILWNIPLGGAHRVTYGVRFRYKKGWISKKEALRINGESFDRYIMGRLTKDEDYTVQRFKSEVTKLASYIVGVIFSPLMRCEGPKEIIV